MVQPSAPPRALALLRDLLATRASRRRLALLAAYAAGLVAVARAAPEPAAVQLYLAAGVAGLVAANFAPRPRAPGEPSAYAAFNPGAAPLLGELRAAQFDAEIRRRPVEWGLDDGDAGGAGGGAPPGGGGGGGGGGRGRPFSGRGRPLGAAGGGSAADADAPAEESAALEATRREIFLEARRTRLAAAVARQRR